MSNQIVKDQFNKQAEKFANWYIGKNTEYLQRYFDFCDIQSNDKVLDVACGPADFTLFIAKRVLKAQGVDISDKEIDIANNLKKEFGLNNVDFDCADVEKLPYKNDSYAVVISKSAFHHFIHADVVFKEMKRCCEPGGKISIQDIVAYQDDYVNTFFEKFDKLVDLSHNSTLNEQEFNRLFSENKIGKIRDFRLTVDLNVNEYLEHASHDHQSRIKIHELLERGIKDDKLRDYLFTKEGELYFSRPVYLILGEK